MRRITEAGVWRSWATRPKWQPPIWSHYIRKTNLCCIIASESDFLFLVLNTFLKVQRWLKETVPKWLVFTHVWELKDKFRGQFNQMPGTKGTAPAPVRTEENCQISLLKAQNSPQWSIKVNSVSQKLIHKQSQGSKMKPVMDAAISCSLAMVLVPSSSTASGSHWRKTWLNRRAGKGRVTFSLQEQEQALMGRKNRPKNRQLLSLLFMRKQTGWESLRTLFESFNWFIHEVLIKYLLHTSSQAACQQDTLECSGVNKARTQIITK